MHAMERLFKVRLEILEGAFGCTGPSYHPVVITRTSLIGLEGAHQGTQATAHAIARDRVADLFGDCESKSWT